MLSWKEAVNKEVLEILQKWFQTDGDKITKEKIRFFRYQMREEEFASLFIIQLYHPSRPFRIWTFHVVSKMAPHVDMSLFEYCRSYLKRKDVPAPIFCQFEILPRLEAFQLQESNFEFLENLFRWFKLFPFGKVFTHFGKWLKKSYTNLTLQLLLNPELSTARIKNLQLQLEEFILKHPYDMELEYFVEKFESDRDLDSDQSLPLVHALKEIIEYRYSPTNFIFLKPPESLDCLARLTLAIKKVLDNSHLYSSSIVESVREIFTDTPLLPRVMKHSHPKIRFMALWELYQRGKHFLEHNYIPRLLKIFSTPVPDDEEKRNSLLQYQSKSIKILREIFQEGQIKENIHSARTLEKFYENLAKSAFKTPFGEIKDQLLALSQDSQIAWYIIVEQFKLLKDNLLTLEEKYGWHSEEDIEIKLAKHRYLSDVGNYFYQLLELSRNKPVIIKQGLKKVLEEVEGRTLEDFKKVAAYEIFQKIYLDTFEEIYRREVSARGKELVQTYLGLILVSQSGLSEEIIEDILSQCLSPQLKKEGVQVDRELVLSLRNSMSTFLLLKEGRLHLVDEETEELVRAKFTEEDLEKYHSLMSIYYFRQEGFGVNKVVNLIYHTIRGGMWERALALITNMEFLILKIKKTSFCSLAKDFQDILHYGDFKCYRRARVELELVEIIKKSLFMTSALHEEEPWKALLLGYFGLYNSAYYKSYSSDYSSKLASQARPKLHKFTMKWRRALEDFDSEIQDYRDWIETPPRIVKEKLPLLSTIEFSPLGGTIALVEGTGKISIRDTYGEIIQMMESESNFTSLAFSPEGEKLATVNSEGTIQIWNIKNQEEELFTARLDKGDIARLNFSPQGDKLASIDGRDLILWDTKTGEKIFHTNDYEKFLDLCFSPNGERIVTGNMEGEVTIWDAKKGKKLFNCGPGYKRGYPHVFSVSYSPDGKKIVSGATDKYARLWDGETGEFFEIFEHDSQVWSTEFSPDGTLVASGSHDSTVRIWDIDSGEEKYRLPHGSLVTNLSFSPDGKQLAVTCYDKIWIWMLPQKYPWDF